MVKLRATLERAGLTAFRSKMSRAYFQRLALDPKTIFDIGVNRGTPWLYQSFAGRKMFLIDPQKDALAEAAGTLPGADIVQIACALGAERGAADLQLRGGKSGMAARTALNAAVEAVSVSVPVRRLDDIVAEHRPAPPYGVKIDTEGYELEVLTGAASTLADTLFIVAEVSIKKRFIDGYRFSDMIALLRQHDFELLDVLNPQPRPPRFMDCLFIRFDHPLFATK